MKVAIMGAGMMGHTHANAYQNLKSKATLTHIVETDIEKRLLFEKKYGCQGLQALEQLPPDIELIDICLPTFAHVSAATQALTICNHVFLEKPACLAPEEWHELSRAASECGKQVMIGHVLRYWNGYVRAKEIVQSGVLGKLQFVQCARRQEKPMWSKSNWLFQREKSGGLLFDLSIHDIDYVTWLLGKPHSLSCCVTSDSSDITLFSTLLMDYGECSANITSAWGMPDGFNGAQLQSRLEIIGSQGMVSYDGENELHLVKDGVETKIPLAVYNPYEREIESFIDSINCQETNSVTDLAAVEDTMEILWAATRAALEHQTIVF